MASPFVYPCRLIDVVDGDTVKLSVQLRRSRAADRDLGFHVYYEDGWVVVHESMRLVGLNAPEKNTPAGVEAATFVRDWFATTPGGELAVVSTVRDTQEKYGRFLATIFKRGGRNLNDELLRYGHAVVWDGRGPRPVPA